LPPARVIGCLIGHLTVDSPQAPPQAHPLLSFIAKLSRNVACLAGQSPIAMLLHGQTVPLIRIASASRRRMICHSPFHEHPSRRMLVRLWPSGSVFSPALLLSVVDFGGAAHTTASRPTSMSMSRLVTAPPMSPEVMAATVRIYATAPGQGRRART
jgi:hypothetical protein